MGRSTVVALGLLGGVASANPYRPTAPPPSDPVELAARVEGAIRNHDSGAVLALLADPVTYDGLWFPDAACAKRFGTQGRVEKAEVRVLAKCLAQQKAIATTRRSGVAGAAILTFDPGFELELAFVNDRVVYVGGEWPRGDDRGRPTLTVQAFEALRTAGTTQLDAALATLTGPASAWIKVCLDERGTATTTLLTAKPTTGSHFLAAIADWRFRPFEHKRTPTAACALSLLSYPAGTAPPVETLPATPTVRLHLPPLPPDDGLIDIFSELPSRSPQTVASSVLEQNRIRGSKHVDPDAATKRTLDKARRSVIASMKLCIDARGNVSHVTALKSSGFPAYDAKIEREMKRWTYKPFLVRRVPAPVCATVTFVYRPTP